MTSLVKNTQRTIPIDTSSARFVLNVLKHQTGFASWDVALWFCSDKTIRQHNKDYRNISKSTDVLSFAVHQCFKQPEDFKATAGPMTDLGDILVSPSFVWRWSLRHGVQPEEQLARVITHGFVHLLGYDHTTADEDAAMLAKEGALLAALPAAAQAAGAEEAQLRCPAESCSANGQCKVQQLRSSPLAHVPALGETADALAAPSADSVCAALLQPCPVCAGAAPHHT